MPLSPASQSAHSTGRETCASARTGNRGTTRGRRRWFRRLTRFVDPVIMEKSRQNKGMLRHAIVSVVTRCTRHAWLTIVIASLLGIASAVYAAKNFAINTDINTLISPDLPWRQRELAFEKAFPQHL